jgi:endonuclease III
VRVNAEPQQLSSPPATPIASKNGAFSKRTPKGSPVTRTKLDAHAAPATPVRSRKRTRAKTLKNEASPGTALHPTIPDEHEPMFKTQRTPKASRQKRDNSAGLELQKKAQSLGIPGYKTPRLKYLTYGLMPGETPFPDHPRPTAEECEQVYTLLSEAHGDHIQPGVAPAPNPKVAGCGEVPSILDALIRTYISSATKMEHANQVIQNVIAKFGTMKDGLGKDSVDWHAVHEAKIGDLRDAIRAGGLEKRKSEHIKGILQMVHDDCREWQEISKGNAVDGLAKGAHTADEVWNLEYLRQLEISEVFIHLLEYPGIGVKTSACVSLFALQRPIFAVDVNIFKLCRGLGWVPSNADELRTFYHCDVKIPDKLKYSLHQLMIAHRKWANCPRCNGRKGKSEEESCVLEHLVDVNLMRGRASGKSPKKRRVDEEGNLDDVLAEEVLEGTGD